jgi:hypothetical protein
MNLPCPWKRGIPNILDYALGLDHLESPHSGLPQGRGEALRFTRRAEAEFLLLVEESDDLTAGSWEIIAFLEPGSGTWTAVADRAIIAEEADGPIYHVTVNPTSPSLPGTPRFWRVTVEVQP